MKTLIAKKLTVSVKSPEGESGQDFEVLEFENGLILVAGCNTNDWYFEDRDSIEPCGLDIVSAVGETEETEEWTQKELQQSYMGSLREFGGDPAHVKILALLSRKA
ncbi:MAG: hypothetical protein ACRC62_07990 [Microcoleus sp.]